MKYFLVFLMLGCSLNSIGQVKKKYFRAYIGRIEAFDLKSNDHEVPVNSANVKLTITKDSIFKQVSTIYYKGKWNLVNETKSSYFLIATYEYGLVENLLIKKKTKMIICNSNDIPYELFRQKKERHR